MNDTPRSKTVLIIGGGIGGPVAAMALARAGFEPRVFEARSEGDDSGSFLNLASNGLDALHTLGIRMTEGFPTPRMILWSGTGKRLGEVANGQTLSDGTVSITIGRSSLHQSLRNEAKRRGIVIEHDKRLVAIENGPSDVTARFDDGTSATAAVLIGADGLHSPTRRILDSACPAPRYTGQLSVGGISRAPDVEATPGSYQMIFGRRGFFGFSVPRVGVAYWFANVASQVTTRAGLAAISLEEWKAQLLELFADDEGPARTLISTTDEVAAYPIHDMPSVRVWHRGRVVLLGDAAHATSPNAGQGASLAIEDAVVLARALRDAPDHSTAFATYERLRRARVEQVVKYSARVGSSKVPGTIGRFLRDAFMPFALKHYATSTAHDWLYGYHIDWNEVALTPAEINQ